MNDPKARIKILVEALPYIQRFHHKVIVVKYGGNAMAAANLKHSFARDVVLLKQVGMHPIVVHGGGPDISTQLQQQNISSRFVHGIRITDDITMTIVESSLAAINQQLCTEIAAAGGQAAGFAKTGQYMIQGRKLHLDEAPETDFGRAGEVGGVVPELLAVASDATHIPVLSPVGEDQTGTTFNVNADLAAAGVATFLQTEKLILMTNTSGILDQDQQLIVSASPAEIAQLIETGVVQGGMLPKVKCAVDAVDRGVRSAHIIDGRVQHALLLELLTDEGVGTLIGSV